MKDLHWIIPAGITLSVLIVIHGSVYISKNYKYWREELRSAERRNDLNTIDVDHMLKLLFRCMRCIDYKGGIPNEIQLQTELYNITEDRKVFNGYKIEVPVVEGKSTLRWYYGLDSSNMWKKMNKKQRRQFTRLIGFLMQLEKDVHDYNTKAESSMRHRNKWARHGTLFPMVYSMLRHRHQ